MLSGRSVPRSVLDSVASELVTIHGQADQLRIASPARQREFLDRYAGNDEAMAAYGRAWEALRAMDKRLERLSSQESSMRQQADYLRESIERIYRIDPQSGKVRNCTLDATASKTQPKSHRVPPRRWRRWMHLRSVTTSTPQVPPN